jgi:hypothetical protein
MAQRQAGQLGADVAVQACDRERRPSNGSQAFAYLPTCRVEAAAEAPDDDGVAVLRAAQPGDAHGPGLGYRGPVEREADVDRNALAGGEVGRSLDRGLGVGDAVER